MVMGWGEWWWGRGVFLIFECLFVLFSFTVYSCVYRTAIPFLYKAMSLCF